MTPNQPTLSAAGFRKSSTAEDDATWLEGPEFPTATSAGPILTAYEEGRKLITVADCELTLDEARRVLRSLDGAVRFMESLF